MVAQESDARPRLVIIHAESSFVPPTEFDTLPRLPNKELDLVRLRNLIGGTVMKLVKHYHLFDYYDEVLNHVLFAIQRYEKEYRGSNLRGWASTITQRKCLDILRARNRLRIKEGTRYDEAERLEGHDRVMVFTREMAPSVEDMVIQGEEDNLVQRLMAELPEKYRIVLQKYYIECEEQLSMGEIGKELGIEGNTVKTQLRRARELLRTLLIAHGYFSTGEVDASESSLQ